MKLVVAGDSWTYGSEIRDPVLPPTIKDWDPENDEYRLPRIWPTKLGNLLGASEVVNLSYPASSNDRIIRTIKEWVIKNYLIDNKPTDDLFLIVGFTSPERKDFYYKDHEMDSWITIWPMLDSNTYKQPAIQEFHKLYVLNMWHKEEYISRYVNQVMDLENFCKIHKIRFLFFQAFYQYREFLLNYWRDNPYALSSPSTVDLMTWNLIDSIRFMHKNEEIHSFHNYIMKIDNMLKTQQAFTGQHPSEQSHTWWASHIFDYCKDNNI